MDTHHAERPPKPGQNRRTHAERAEGDYAPCGARLGSTVSSSSDADEVTCLACRARLRDAGDLPMTRHALARRS